MQRQLHISCIFSISILKHDGMRPTVTFWWVLVGVSPAMPNLDLLAYFFFLLHA